MEPVDAKVSLDAAGVVAMIDFTTIARRTAFTDTVTFRDTLAIYPGVRRQ